MASGQLFLLLATLFQLSCAVDSSGPAANEVKPAMNIKVQLDKTMLDAALDRSAVAFDFASLLPMDLTLADYGGTEKIAYLPRKLATAGSPAGYTPKRGDIAYYAPWGNLAIFCKDFSYSEGLVRLGRLDGGLDAVCKEGDILIRISPL
jgi:hypothetical protein